MIAKHYLPLATFMLMALCIPAQDADKDFQTKTASIFKYGTAFFLKTGKLNTIDGFDRMTENIPSALFGTLWIKSPTGDLKHISGYTDELKSQKVYQAKP